MGLTAEPLLRSILSSAAGAFSGRSAERLPLEELGTRAAGAPRLRGHCHYVSRPCPWVGCRYHLYMDLRNNRSGGPSVKLYHPGQEPEEIPAHLSCALDWAEAHAGEITTLSELAQIFGRTRERLRQIERMALAHLHVALLAAGIDEREVAETISRNPSEEAEPEYHDRARVRCGPVDQQRDTTSRASAVRQLEPRAVELELKAAAAARARRARRARRLSTEPGPTPVGPPPRRTDTLQLLG